MKIVALDSAGSRDIDVGLDGTMTSVADLARSLGFVAADASDAEASLFVDGFYTPGDLAVGEAGIHEGAEVRPAGRGPAAPGAHGEAPALVGAAELCVTAGLRAGSRIPLTVGSHLVGRGRDCEVVFAETTISRHHCRIDIDPVGQAVVANLSEHGTFVSGQKITEPTRLTADAVLEIGSIALTVRPPVQGDQPAGVDRFHDLTSSGTINLNRPPRFAPPADPEPLAVPKEPAEGQKAPFNIATIVAPALMGGVMVIALHSILYAMFAILSPIMMVGNWWETKHRSTKALRRDTRKYREGLQTLEEGLEQAGDWEAERKRSMAPDPAEVLRRATAPSVRLWERRPDDKDFLSLSAGIGDVKWQPGLAGRPPGLPEEVTELLARHGQLRSVPVEVDLAEGGVVGLVGDRTSAVAIARALLTQAAVHHGPADLRIAVLTAGGDTDTWDWTKWLPHTRDHRPSATERRLLAASPSEAVTLLEGLLADAPKPTVGHKPEGPTTLYVFDGDELLIGRNSAARAALRGGAGPAAGIVLASSSDRLPAVCSAILTVDEWGAGRITQPRRGDEVQELLVAGLSEAAGRGAALALARFEDPEVRAPGSALPDLILLPPLLRLDQLTPGAVTSRWAEGGGGFHLRAPIGASENGDFWLDLDRHGPHGLIGGTTGSGKSELLKTLVAAFAATYSPAELTFGLFDFKGGSTFTEFANLPHTVGMASDLDVHLARRALLCLRAELLQRERLFDKAGVKDLADYRVRRNAGDRTADGADLPPVPRLIVIIDEFAAMATELAEEIGALTDLTARGRSLGVHLLLATQKPSTSVNAEIRTNTRLRISLQVEDKQDSVDVIGIPDAALIRQKGRGFFRVGQTDVVPLQTALASGTSASRQAGRVDIAPFVFGLEPRGRVDKPAAAKTDGPAAANDLVQLVDAVTGAFNDSGLPTPRRPWPDPLPAELPLAELEQVADSAPPGGRDPGTVYFALADDPAGQTRYPAGWSLRQGNFLIFGVVGSGTSTALASLGLAFCTGRNADRGHLYALDFGSGALQPLEGLPHCGAFIPATDGERQIRLIRYLRGELDRRRKLSAEARAQLPTILLLLDNVEGFRAEYEDAYGLGILEAAMRLWADGPDAGIYVAGTATRAGGVPAALSSATPQKLLLRLSDAAEYGAFSISRHQLPTSLPGRGLIATTAQVIQIARPAPDLATAVEAVRRSTPTPAHGPANMGSLPTEISQDRLGQTAALVTSERWNLPVGLADEDLGPASLVLYEHEHAMVAGPARSGRSSTLLTLAAALRSAAPEARVLGIACRRSPLRDHNLLDQVATTVDEVAGVVDAALVSRGPTLLLVDDADTLDDANGRLSQLLSAGNGDLHVAASGRSDALRTLFGHWTQIVRRSKAGVLLQPALDLDGDILGARLPRRLHTQLPPGRGFLVCDGQSQLIQAALPPSTNRQMSGAR